MTGAPERRRNDKVSLAASFAAAILLIVNLGVVVTYATSIQSKLDGIHQASNRNCELLRTAIILTIEQTASTPAEHVAAHRLEQNFVGIQCGNSG